MKRVGGFREAVVARKKRESEIRAGQFAEAMKLAIDRGQEKNKLRVATLLVQSRFPPLWSGQEYDRWRVEVEKWFDNNKL